MKKRILVLGVSLFIVLGSTLAWAESYIAGNIGVGWVEDIDLSDGVDRAELSFDTGFGITAALGHAYPNGLRAELEVGYFQSDLDDVTLEGFGTASVDGEGTLWYGMINGFYDFMPTQTISPFVGLGIGYAKADLEIEGESEDDNVFAFQAALGMAFQINERLKCDLQYRYFDTEEPDFGDGVDSDSITIHSVLAGLRYSF